MAERVLFCGQATQANPPLLTAVLIAEANLSAVPFGNLRAGSARRYSLAIPVGARMASRIPWRSFLSAGTMVARAPRKITFAFSTKK